MKKVISLFMACALCLCTAIPAFAAEDVATPNDELVGGATVNDATDETPGISPMAYYDLGTMTFSGKGSTSKNCYDGGRMAFEVSCWSDTPGLDIQAIVHIDGYKALMHKVPVDGQTYKWDWIPLGTNSGRNVYIEYVCDQNPDAVIHVKTTAYSW